MKQFLEFGHYRNPTLHFDWIAVSQDPYFIAISGISALLGIISAAIAYKNWLLRGIAEKDNLISIQKDQIKGYQSSVRDKQAEIEMLSSRLIETKLKRIHQNIADNNQEIVREGYLDLLVELTPAIDEALTFLAMSQPDNLPETKRYAQIAVLLTGNKKMQVLLQELHAYEALQAGRSGDAGKKSESLDQLSMLVLRDFDPQIASIILLQLLDQAQYVLAEAISRKLIQALSGNFSERAFFAQALSCLGISLYRQGSYQDALPPLEEALSISEELSTSGSTATASIMDSIAAVYYATGEYEKAFPLMNRSLEMRETLLDPKHIDIAVSLNNMASLCQAMGLYDEALPLYQRAKAIQEDVYGPTHQELAMTLNNMAALYQRVGQYDESLPLRQRAQKIFECELGPMHPHVAMSMFNLGSLYESMGLDEEAKPCYERAVTIYETALAPMHPDVAMGFESLASLHLKMGHYEEALPASERSLALHQAIYGGEHQKTLQAKATLESCQQYLSGGTVKARQQHCGGCAKPISLCECHTVDVFLPSGIEPPLPTPPVTNA